MTATEQETVVVNDSENEWTPQLGRYIVGTTQLEGSDSVHVSIHEDESNQLQRVLRCCSSSSFFGSGGRRSGGSDSSHNYLVCIWNELVKLSKTMFPALVGMVMNKVPGLISLRFVGVIGMDELAAAALALTLSNVTGLFLCDGLTSALTTLAGQSRGSIIQKYSTNKNNNNNNVEEEQQQQAQPQEFHVNEATEVSPLVSQQQQQEQIDPYNVAEQQQVQLQPIIFLFRGLFILIVIVGPVVIWWIWGIGPVLIALGQNPKLSYMTEQYLQILAPGLLMYCIGWTITAWLQAMEMAHIPATAAVVALCTHIPINLLYIDVMNWMWTSIHIRSNCSYLLLDCWNSIKLLDCLYTT